MNQAIRVAVGILLILIGAFFATFMIDAGFVGGAYTFNTVTFLVLGAIPFLAGVWMLVTRKKHKTYLSIWISLLGAALSVSLGIVYHDNVTVRGTLSWSNGDEYAGEVRAAVPHGEGKLKYSDGGTYVGQFKDGVRWGKGTLVYSDGTTHVGEFKNGNAEGRGILTQADGSKYVGEFKNGNAEGRGMLTQADGSKFVGRFKDNEFFEGDEFPGNGKNIPGDGGDRRVAGNAGIEVALSAADETLEPAVAAAVDAAAESPAPTDTAIASGNVPPERLQGRQPSQSVPQNEATIIQTTVARVYRIADKLEGGVRCGVLVVGPSGAHLENITLYNGSTHPNGNCHQGKIAAAFAFRVASGNPNYRWIGAWCGPYESRHPDERGMYRLGEVAFASNGQLTRCAFPTRTWVDVKSAHGPGSAPPTPELATVELNERGEMERWTDQNNGRNTWH